jgi:hypothetical protein
VAQADKPNLKCGLNSPVQMTRKDRNRREPPCCTLSAFGHTTAMRRSPSHRQVRHNEPKGKNFLIISRQSARQGVQPVDARTSKAGWRDDQLAAGATG